MENFFQVLLFALLPSLLIALGQVTADVPEGFASIASLKGVGYSRGKRLLLSASFAIPIVIGATVGYWAVKGRPEIVKMSLLSFTAGVLLTVAVEEMITKAHASGRSRFESINLVAGFALLALMSVYLG